MRRLFSEKPDVKFISNKNRQWLDGKRAELDRSREVHYNIARRMGLATQGCSGCTIMIYGTAYGVGCLVAGIFPLTMIFRDFMRGVSLDNPEALFAYGVSIPTCIVALLMGRHYLREVSKRVKHNQQLGDYIKQLIATGTVIYGEVVASEWAKYDAEYTMAGGRTITYRFTPPNSQETLDANYFSSVNKVFSTGDKVAVLYLNPDIHILL